MFVQNIGFAGDVGYVDNTTLYFKEGPVSLNSEMIVHQALFWKQFAY